MGHGQTVPERLVYGNAATGEPVEEPQAITVEPAAPTLFDLTVEHKMFKNQDQTGDAAKDTGDKFAEFVKGGTSGWRILGNRWEGYSALWPQIDVIVEGARRKIDEPPKPLLDEVAGALEAGRQRSTRPAPTWSPWWNGCMPRRRP
ncbi:MAG: hypothetical protein KDA22_13440 [Phycisphaerales bacterium]|nr:hypothetical protein [Phycisphaerales bacterium]